MYDFFFDSADVNFIRNTWNTIKDVTEPKYVRGVTTNPKAMHRVDCFTLESWKNKANELCQLVSEIRGDSKGVVYVQLPDCETTPENAIAFAKEIQGWTDGITKIGMKIPPYKKILEVVDELEKYAETNVTGIADTATALFAASYGVRYVSIIPGRMEEVGIDSDAHLRLTTDSNLGRTEVIAGSMRTIDGLKRSVTLNTVPTIGGTVFGLVTEDLTALNREEVQFSTNKPLTDERNVNLSESFFVEMNSLGLQAAKDFGLIE